MTNIFNKFRAISLYHNEMLHGFDSGFRKFKNNKEIIWIDNTIYFLSDLWEGGKELITFDTNIKLIDILDDFTFFVTTNKNSYIIYFNNDYSIYKKMNLFKTELLIILDNNTIIVSENNDDNSMKKLIIMKKEEKKYRHFIHIIDNLYISKNDKYKIFKVINKKFIFYHNSNFIYYIYSIDFKNRKFIINKDWYNEKDDGGDFISIIPINGKYIIKFVYKKELILKLINLKTFQIIYCYLTNLTIKELNSRDCENNQTPFLFFNDINEIPFYHLIKYLGIEKFENFNNKKSKMKKGFKTIILREKNNLYKFFVFYIYQNYKIYMESYEINFDEILKSKIELVNDDDDLLCYQNNKDLTFNNVLYGEKENTILINEKEDYFVIMVGHIDGWFHSCVQIILYYILKVNYCD